jgi:hypothetical protein
MGAAIDDNHKAPVGGAREESERVATKKYTYQEVVQMEAKRRAKAAATRRANKRAEREAWWAATPAHGNYVELKASWATRDGDMDRPGTVSVSGRILPDKRQADRRWSALSVSLTVRGDADRGAIARHLTELASLILTSEEPWQTATGGTLPQPVGVEGLPIQVVPERPWPQTQTNTAPTSETSDAEPPTDTIPSPTERPLTDLLRLRTRLQRWLSAHRTDDSPLALLTVEQLAEVLLMRVCGDDIALVSEQDPWRWDHTAEELRAAEVSLADEIEALSALVTDLNHNAGPSWAIATLLNVFVQGRFS